MATQHPRSDGGGSQSNLQVSEQLDNVALRADVQQSPSGNSPIEPADHSTTMHEKKQNTQEDIPPEPVSQDDRLTESKVKGETISTSKKAQEYAEALHLIRTRMEALEQKLRDEGLEIPSTGYDKSESADRTSNKDDSKALLDVKDQVSALEHKDAGRGGRRPIKKRTKHIRERSRRRDRLRSNRSESEWESGSESRSENESDDGSEATEERLPAIPKLHYVDWTDFKNRFAEAKQNYAVEVLVGGARYHYQRTEEDIKSRKKLEDNREHQENGEEKKDKSFSELEGYKEIHERIRINSRPILLNLSRIDPAGSYDAKSVVMLRPFKPLIYYESAIRQRLQELENKWGKLDAGIDTKPDGDEGHSSSNTVRNLNSSNSLEAADKAAAKQDGNLVNAFKPSAPETNDEATVRSSSQNNACAETMGQSTPPIGPSEPMNPVNHLEEESETARNSTTSAYENHARMLSTANEPSIVDQAAAGKGSVQGKGSDNQVSNQKKDELTDLADCEEAFQDFKCLVAFMDQELKPLLDSIKNTTQKKIAFSELWYLFPPGELVLEPLGSRSESESVEVVGGVEFNKRPNDRYQEAWRVYSSANGRPNLGAKGTDKHGFKPVTDSVNYFTFGTYHLDFTGSRFITQYFEFSIKPFQGQREITSLEVYPVKFAPEGASKVAKWESRGKSFLEYMRFQQRYYKGRSLICHPSGLRRDVDGFSRHAESIDSQVVVDFAEVLDAHPGWQRPAGITPVVPETAPREFIEDYDLIYWKDRDQRDRHHWEKEFILKDQHIDTKMMDDYSKEDEMLKNNPDSSLAEEGKFDARHLVLLPNRVFAFVLRNRKFALLTVDGLQPIQRHSNGFGDLQLPSDHKQVVLSLVSNHLINKGADAHDLDAGADADLVRGKGNGLVVLLHGVPGVGKTSTAECVAEAFGKLLFPITCGDLGMTAEDVEAELSEKFHLAELWDCILLLDEADVFLARRTHSDIKRNSLVSVFLRMLEYFTGILFLTTNRVGAFDEAFRSRIHMSLYYPPLDWKQTDEIWKVNLKRLINRKQRRREILHMDEEDILSYAKNHFRATKENTNWNGRQIKNAVQTAAALAEYEAQQKTDKSIAEYSAMLRQAGGNAADIGPRPGPIDPVLRVSHFHKVAVASHEFDRYVAATRGMSDAEAAEINNERFDEFRPNSEPFQRREQQRAPTYMAPPNTFAPRNDPYVRAQQQPIPYNNQAPLVERSHAYHSTAQFFADGSSYSPDPMSSNPTGLGTHRDPQARQQFASPHTATNPGAQQGFAPQNIPRTSLGPSYTESSQFIPQATGPEYDRTFHTPASRLTKAPTWEAERADASDLYNQQRPQPRSGVSQAQMSPQRHEPLLQQMPAQQQFRAGSTIDSNAFFG